MIRPGQQQIATINNQQAEIAQGNQGNQLRANTDTRIPSPMQKPQSDFLLVPGENESIERGSFNETMQLQKKLDEAKIIDNITDCEVLTTPNYVLTSCRPHIDQMKLLICPDQM